MDKKMRIKRQIEETRQVLNNKLLLSYICVNQIQVRSSINLRFLTIKKSENHPFLLYYFFKALINNF